MKKFVIYEDDIRKAVTSLVVGRKRMNGDLDHLEDEPTYVTFVYDDREGVSCTVGFRKKRKHSLPKK